MRKLNLTFAHQIAEQLSLLCANRPKACKKDGAMGWVSNDRVIVVRRGFFEYYNLHPGFFEDDLSSVRDTFFKAAVRLDFIHELNYLPKNKTRKTLIQLIFPKKRIMRRQPTQQTAEEQEGGQMEVSGDLQKWVFQFKIDVKEYVEQKREEQKEERRKLSKIEQSAQKTLTEDPNLAIQTPQPALIEDGDDLEDNIEEYVQSVQKTKFFLKNKAEMAEEEAARLRRKKEKEKAEMVNSKTQSGEDPYLISAFWREYFKMVETVLLEKQREGRLLSELNMLKLIESFNETACKVIKSYVQERGVGWDGARKNMAGFRYYQGLWLKIGGKELNQQFLVNYNLNDIFYSLPEIKKMKFRLPLMSLMEYRGLKILVMCDMPFSELEKSAVYNLLNEGFDLQLMGKIKQALEVIEDTLNVKSQPVDLTSKKKITAPLGLHLQIYEYNFNKDKNQDQATLPNFYYLINPGIVFPLDFNAQRESINSLARLRPEFVAAYRDYQTKSSPQLLSQAFMTSSMPEAFQKHEDEKVIKASRLVVVLRVKELVSRLNSLDLLIVDSYSIKTMMHEMGINVRYLYLLYELADVPYIREHVLADALARTIKAEFRSALSQLQKQQIDAYHSQFLLMKINERIFTVRDKVLNSEDLYKDFALDYLNLVFGTGHQSQEFWKIVIKRCRQNFRIEAKYPPEIKPGVLLHAVLDQCGLKATYHKDIALFKVERPFESRQQVDYRVELKTYDFPSFEIQKMFRSAPSLEDHVTMQIFQKSTEKLLKLQLLFYNTLKMNFQGSAAICKMHNYKEFLTKVQQQNPLHPIVIPFYIANKSEYNFRQALEVASFSLPDTHPLYISIYNEYSSILQPELLKKTALMTAVKCLGQFHQKTTELYEELYHEGKSQYAVKVKRIVTIDGCSLICAEMFNDQKYQSCLRYVQEQIESINKPGSQKLGAGNYQKYVRMLMQGLESSIRTIQLRRGLAISEEVSNVISAFKVKDLQLTYDLFRQVLVIQMLLSKNKYFLYKMVLFAVHIRTKHEQVELDEEGCTVPVGNQARMQFLEGLSEEYYVFQNHSNWVKHVIDTLLRSFQYFNYLEDLFNNYTAHIRRYNNDTFKQCLSFWDVLIRVYGQRLFKSTLYDVKFN